MGSLVTALASYLHIKQRNGRWLIRIDNLDPPREDATAIPRILNSLRLHGLHTDGLVQYQADHDERYSHALAELSASLFYCNCTRKSLRGLDRYPGTCRNKTQPRADHAVRLRVNNTPIEYEDKCLGRRRTDLSLEGGDFIVRRRDSLWAYNLATAVDDGLDMTHILRGQDLLEVTPQQLYVMSKLGLKAPSYTHIPLLCYPDGTKLSKQTHAPPLIDHMAPLNLRNALAYMGLAAPEQDNQTVEFWIAWGLRHWRVAALPRTLPPFMDTTGAA